MDGKAVALIPARLSAERLPGKPLRLLAGEPLIKRVYEAVKRTALFTDIYVLTDSKKIMDTVNSFGGIPLMTSSDCQSGTERVLEIRKKLKQEIIINVQGDEPFIDKRSLVSLIGLFRNSDVEIASLMQRVNDPAGLESPDTVKVTVNKDQYALYFSRQIIPYNRNGQANNPVPYFRHIGVYAFRNTVLDGLAALGEGTLERAEKLEQLRWLEYGYRIKMAETDYAGWGIDTEEDLAKAEFRFKELSLS